VSDLSTRAAAELRNWAAWLISLDHHKFYPGSIAGRLDAVPGGARGSTVPSLVWGNAAAEQVDAALRKLRAQHRIAHAVVTRHYLDGSAVPVKAGDLGLSPRAYKRLLERATWFVAGAL